MKFLFVLLLIVSLFACKEKEIGFGFDFTNKILERNLLDEYVETGASFGAITIQIPKVQSTPGGAYDWTKSKGGYNPDLLINNTAGIEMVPRIEFSCEDPAACTEWVVGPDFQLLNEEALRAFLTTMVNRYKNKVHNWRIDNEQDYYFEKDLEKYPQNKEGWSNRTVNFINLLKVCSEAIKAADPKAKIGHTSTFTYISQSYSPDLNPYKGVDAVIELEALKYIDFIDLHIYGGEMKDSDAYLAWPNKEQMCEPHVDGASREIKNEYHWFWKRWIDEPMGSKKYYCMSVKGEDYISEVKRKLIEAGYPKIALWVQESGQSTGPFKAPGEEGRSVYEANVKKAQIDNIKMITVATSEGVTNFNIAIFRDTEWHGEGTGSSKRCVGLDWRCRGLTTADIYKGGPYASYNNHKKETFDSASAIIKMLTKAVFQKKMSLGESSVLYRYIKGTELIFIGWNTKDTLEKPMIIVPGKFNNAKTKVINAITLEPIIDAKIIVKSDGLIIEDVNFTKNTPFYIILSLY